MKTFTRLVACCFVVPIGLMAQQDATAKGANGPSLEQRVRAIEDREAILHTLREYVYTGDFGKDPRHYTDLYTEDAVFQSIASPPSGSAVATDLAARADKGTGTGAVVGRHALDEWIINEWRMRDLSRAE
jgi:hypothetical protein